MMMGGMGRRGRGHECNDGGSPRETTRYAASGTTRGSKPGVQSQATPLYAQSAERTRSSTRPGRTRPPSTPSPMGIRATCRRFPVPPSGTSARRRSIARATAGSTPPSSPRKTPRRSSSNSSARSSSSSLATSPPSRTSTSPSRSPSPCSSRARSTGSTRRRPRRSSSLSAKPGGIVARAIPR